MSKMGNIMAAARNGSFADLVSQENIVTAADVESYGREGYQVGYTLGEFTTEFPSVDPAKFFYSNQLGTSAYYWDKEALVIFPVHLYGKQLLTLGGVEETLETTVQKGIESFHREMARKNYSFLILGMSDRMRMEYLRMMLSSDACIEGAYGLFLGVYQASDYGCSELGRDGVLKLMAMKSEAEKQNTKEALAELPGDVITVYRGAGQNSAPVDNAFSWTTDLAVANFFATRFGMDDAVIYSGKVRKEDVLEYMNDEEYECIVLPESVMERTAFELYGAGWVQENLPEVAATFRDYWEQADYTRIPFEKESDIHGKMHSKRVLLLALFLGMLRYLSDEDMDILAEAALYHDVGRWCDGVEPKHGTRSAKLYKKACGKVDPLITFLMKFHCRPDEEGYRYIDEMPELACQKARAVELFKVFKDADNLDRVRLGVRALDPAQLRTEEARRMTLVAELLKDEINDDE